jgi:hypothetical protein
MAICRFLLLVRNAGTFHSRLQSIKLVYILVFYKYGTGWDTRMLPVINPTRSFYLLVYEPHFNQTMPLFSGNFLWSMPPKDLQSRFRSQT